ncbi:MAG: CPBP family intramembrane metalloprotease [Clostridiales bacterium]|nr:CPBP family intramembrane metalloprotease [Clostridiales bacterium]
MNKIKQFIKNVSPLNNRTDMPLILYVIKVVIIFFFVKFGSELIGEAFAIGLHFACGKNPLQGELFDLNTITLITYYGYALMIGVFVLYWKLFQKKTLAQLGFTKKAGTYLIGGVAGAVLVTVCVFAVVLTGAVSYNGMFGSIDHSFILLMLGAFVFQGAMEEVLCRGIVLQLLKEKASTPVAVAVSTALFVYPHVSKMSAEDPAIFAFAVINLILISLLFSFLTLRFKSIWAACGLHTVWNFILCNVLGLNLSGNDTMTAAVFDMRSVGSGVLNGGEYGIEASAVTAGVLALALALCFALSYKKAPAMAKGKLASAN